ncbi:hypothetical protein, partial [Aeromonas salmonicida]|uniref:hypothetical protein n=1 Tax=Aeromonas salmonicida TaxID=645 RepID=UPI003D322376
MASEICKRDSVSTQHQTAIDPRQGARRDRRTVRTLHVVAQHIAAQHQAGFARHARVAVVCLLYTSD